MVSLVYLGLVYLFSSAYHVTSIAVGDESSSLAEKVEAILRNTDTTVHGLDKINVRLDAIEAAIRKLGENENPKEKDAPTEYLVKGLPSVPNDNRDLDEVVQLARSGHFDKVDEKLIQMGDAVDIPKIVNRLYGNCENSFELLVDFAKGVSKITHSFEILKSLYEQMKANGHNDTGNLIILTGTLESQVVNQNNDPKQIKMKAIPIINELKRTIHKASTEFLIDAMEQQSYIVNHEVQDLAGTLAAHLPELSDKVMKSLIDGTYEKLGPGPILNNLNGLRNTSQALSAITSLYWKVKEEGNYTSISNSLMLDFAYNLAHLQDRRDFVEISAARRSELESVKVSIPTCARNLFFATNVCLWNVGTKTNLEASTNYLTFDKERRNIFTTAFKGNDSLYEMYPFGATWTVEKVGEKIFFKSFDSEEYLYVAIGDVKNMPYSHYVFSWIPGRNTDDQSAWAIELDDEHCYIKSIYYNEYLYASVKKHDRDDHYSYVFTMKPGILSKNDEFRWQVRDC